MQALSCGYYFFFLSTLLALWLVWFAVGRWPARRVLTLTIVWIVAALPLVPVLRGYQTILRDTYGFSRGLEEVGLYGADLAGLLHAPGDSLLWRWLHVTTRGESEIFPGLTVMILTLLAIRMAGPFAERQDAPRARTVRRIFAGLFVVLVGIWIIPIVHGPWRLTVAGVRLFSVARPDKPLMLAVLAAFGYLATLPRMRSAVRGRSPLTFYLIAAFLMWFLALGPDPSLLNMRVLYQAPYGWLMRLPGFDGLRVPARFWMMTIVCLSAIAALGLDQFRGRARRTAVSLATLGLLLDGWPGVFNVLPRPDLRPSPPGVAVRLNLPITDDEDALSLYQQPFDPVPVYNGFSGYAAPHYPAMREMLKLHDARILQAMSANGPLGIVIDHDADADGTMRQFVLGFRGVVREQAHPAWSSYRLPASGIAPPPDEAGRPLAMKALTAFPSQPHAARAVDGNRTTRWSGGVQTQQADFTIELEQPTYVGQVVIELGPFLTDYAQRLRIEISADGSSWETIFLGDTRLQAYYAAVRHPKEIPVVFPIGRDNVRFVRLQQTGWGTHDWSIAEIRVTGR